MGIGGRMGAGASLRVGAPTGYQTSLGSPFPGVTDTAPTLIGGPSGIGSGQPPSIWSQPQTIIALGAAAYLFLVYICFHHY